MGASSRCCRVAAAHDLCELWDLRPRENTTRTVFRRLLTSGADRLSHGRIGDLHNMLEHSRRHRGSLWHICSKKHESVTFVSAVSESCCRENLPPIAAHREIDPSGSIEQSSEQHGQYLGWEDATADRNRSCMDG